ncbi:pyrroline-5-carboxylate reductase [Phenylobacterium deserti]|uniref:Pyrroline-5-carboxylate reductase n=1 Tax=Phenylobacterium deserti TaxID=1914756 RepID=A0A328AX63_9CAUL|nr:pyrroline-5-carboxylate reductase [Phenylobacterium deserti]RAK58296.1 pyrroline-5-carboxylate reductase [Phenylobacterium deserti]
MTPILMLGAGRMGGAMLAGWRKAGAFAASDLMIRDPNPGQAAAQLGAEGAQLNPADADLARARTVVLAVKPQLWREAAAETVSWLSEDAVIVSVAAGVKSADISREFGGRPVARVMPTTAAAIGQGTASLYADDPAALSRARALFEPLGAVVDLADENLMHAATAVSGSAPAYLYAFIEALEAAGVTAGLKPKDAAGLARSTITGAAALLAEGGEEPSELRRQVTSPGGTTQAALDVLLTEPSLQTLLREAVAAAVRRSKELGA